LKYKNMAAIRPPRADAPAIRACGMPATRPRRAGIPAIREPRADAPATCPARPRGRKG
jgi:hypothetical protein